LRLFRILGKLLLALLGVIVAYLALAIVLSLIPTRPGPISNAERQLMYISSNGVHTDFVIRRDHLPADLLGELGELATYEYLGFGWGDKGFYLDTPTWADLEPGTAIRAMLLPSPTAVHVTGYDTVGDDWATLAVTAWQLEQLLVYLRSTFSYGATGQIQPIDHPGYGDNDRFYEAVGSYNAIVTCNTWINRGLKRMHVRTALWAPSEWGIMRWRREALG
jgi:uncharacterized protein (TIGR02117 family)